MVRGSSETLRPSQAVARFTERVLGQTTDAKSALLERVGELRNESQKLGPIKDLTKLFAPRKIFQYEVRGNLGSEGWIEPLSRSFEGGFRLVVNRRSHSTRQRFTVAHEICHTFFYEVVPEFKFLPHAVDEEEEELCNLGAAEILMPAVDVRRRASGVSESLISLEQLASVYEVSLQAMLVRLRWLGLWNSELSIWRKNTNGQFFPTVLHGSSRLAAGTQKKSGTNWQWTDTAHLESALTRECTQPLTGQTFVHCQDSQGLWWAKKVNFQIVRRSKVIIALWAPGQSKEQTLPLFQAD